MVDLKAAERAVKLDILLAVEMVVLSAVATAARSAALRVAVKVVSMECLKVAR